jgi:leader peptidase (prepilin peptidase) / N-methyltransferase
LHHHRREVSSTELAALFTGALCSGLAVPALTARGLQQLGSPESSTRALRTVGASVGAVVGATTVFAAWRVDNRVLALALVVWGVVLVAASSCDAATQRIPTALVRQAIVLVSLLLTSSFVLHRDWSALLTSMVAAVASGLLLLLCWRVAGAGFGDVRLAVLGGLGLGHATHRGLLLAVIAMALATLMQTTIVLRRGGNLQTAIAFGPVLSVGFLIAVAV